MVKKKRKKKTAKRDSSSARLLSEINGLRKEFRKFNQSKLIAALSGLHVHPRNHSQTLRLEIASLAACSIGKSGKRKIKLNQLRKVLNKYLPTQCYSGMMEDPLEYPFTENIQFYSGNYIVYPGITQGGALVLRTLVRSIFFDREEFPRSFLATVQAATLSLLLLSNEVASRLGHSRFMNSPERWKEYIEVPDSSQLSRLSRAVIFTKQDIDTLFGRIEFSSPLLLPFITQIGNHNLLKSDSISNNPLMVKPLVMIDDRIILALPNSITSALRHFILITSQKLGALELLVRRFRETLWMDVQKCLIQMSFEPVDLDLPPWEENLPVSEGIFRIDIEKVAYVQLVVDDARNYSENEPFAMCRLDDVSRRICDRQEAIVKWLTSGDQPVCQEVFLIIVLGGIGRPVSLGLGRLPKNARILLISDDDLEVVSQLRDCNSLTLWKFAGSETRLLDSAQVSPHSFLDIYALYLDYHHSFNLSDEKKFDYIPIDPGYGRSLRVKAAKMNDIHAALKGNPPCYVSVCRRYEDESIPIYFMGDATGRSLDLLVEGYTLPIWIGPQRELERIPKEPREIYFELTDMFSYWIWQLTPSLRPHLESLGKYPIQIAFDLENSRSWINPGEEKVKKNESPPEFKSEIHERTIMFTIPETIRPYLQKADNQGERLILDALMQSFDGMLDKDSQYQNLDEEERKRILDIHAPLGPKKKFFFIDAGRNVSLNPHFLPEFRTVPEHDIEEQLDGLVEAIGEEIPAEEILIDKEKRTEYLRRIVDAYLHRLKTVLPNFAWQPLLEQLIGYNEAIWYQREFRKLTIPTTIECFTDLQSHVRELAKELPELESTALTVRTLIEIVAAEPPKGRREVSMDDLDGLLAITYHLVNWATLSDHIHLGIFDHELSILPSGRIGVERESLENTWDPFVEAKTVERVERAIASFQSQFEFEEKSEEIDLQKNDYESVFKAEFGLTLIQIGKFYNCLIQLGFDQRTDAPHLHLSKLKSRLRETLGWDNAEIERAINLFSLAPREKWEEAPEGFDAREDIWPWRYNRLLSHMRRPLIMGPEPEDDPLVFWGPRHMDRTGEQLLVLVLSGRYKTQKDSSEEMKAFIGRIQDKAGKEFKNKVKYWLEENTNWQVDSEVPMKPGEALNPEIDLGDIDILAIDNIEKKIYCIECKNVNYGRNPREIANEIERVMGKDGKGDSWINKHLKRDAWLKSNISVLTSAYNLSSESFKLCSFVLTAEEIPTTYIRNIPLPFVSFTCLKRVGLKTLHDLFRLGFDSNYPPNL